MSIFDRLRGPRLDAGLARAALALAASGAPRLPAVLRPPRDPARLPSWMVPVLEMLPGSEAVLDLRDAPWLGDGSPMLALLDAIGVTAVGACGAHAPGPLPAVGASDLARTWRSRLPALRVVRGRVRGGEVHESPDGDLDVAGSLPSSAEAVAAGSVRVRGVLGGRVVAGASDPSAQVVCGALDAEIVSIGGTYVTGDRIDPALRGRPVRIRRAGGGLRIEELVPPP